MLSESVYGLTNTDIWNLLNKLRCGLFVGFAPPSLAHQGGHSLVPQGCGLPRRAGWTSPPGKPLAPNAKTLRISQQHQQTYEGRGTSRPRRRDLVCSPTDTVCRPQQALVPRHDLLSQVVYQRAALPGSLFAERTLVREV